MKLLEKDHLRSIREVTDSTGTLVASYDYTPYGTRTLTSGSDISDFGYTGHFTHAKSGLLLAPYRAYDPQLGRWLSRDPIQEGDGPNLYAYVHNDPIGRIDPSGLFFEPIYYWFFPRPHDLSIFQISGAQRERLNEALQHVASTPTGQKMIGYLEERGEKYHIIGSIGCKPHRKGNSIYLNPGVQIQVEDMNGSSRTTTLERTLAHEMYHLWAKGGREMDAIFYENQFALEFYGATTWRRSYDY